MKRSIEEQQALGRVLTRIRSAQNFTQEKLSARSGVPVRTIQRSERGDGISAENLDAIAVALGVATEKILAAATSERAAPPDLRLTFRSIDSGAEFVRQLKRRGRNMQVGPQGEDAFNEQIGGLVLDIAAAVKEDSGVSAVDVLENADYLIGFCRHMGYAVFVCHYSEEERESGKVNRYPTTLVLAAAHSDPRIRKTTKGTVLDFVMDQRKQIVQGLMKRTPTTYDWMEEQLLTRSNGDARVRAALQEIHDDVRNAAKRKRDHA